jgi:hypothetical protein
LPSEAKRGTGALLLEDPSFIASLAEDAQALLQARLFGDKGDD